MQDKGYVMHNAISLSVCVYIRVHGSAARTCICDSENRLLEIGVYCFDVTTR